MDTIADTGSVLGYHGWRNRNGFCYREYQKRTYPVLAPLKNSCLHRAKSSNYRVIATAKTQAGQRLCDSTKQAKFPASIAILLGVPNYPHTVLHSILRLPIFSRYRSNLVPPKSPFSMSAQGFQAITIFFFSAVIATSPALAQSQNPTTGAASPTPSLPRLRLQTRPQQ
jgi:hypothetical protein